MPIVLAEPFIPEYGLTFNGTSQYGRHTTSLGNMLATSLWFTPTTTKTSGSSGQGLVQFDGQPTPNFSIATGSVTGSISGEVLTMAYNSGITPRTAVTGITFTGGTTYHIVFNWNSGANRYDIIIDNVIQTVVSGGGHSPIMPINKVIVAGSVNDSGVPDPAAYMDMTISNLELFDTALTSPQITALYNGGKNGSTGTTGNEVAIYRFDDGMGSFAADSSGNNNDLTLYNSPTWLP